MKSKRARTTSAPSARKRSTARKPKGASLATPKEVAMDDAAFEIARVWIGKTKMTAALSLVSRQVRENHSPDRRLV